MPCTPGLCPYATWVDGVGINRAHYSGYTAGLGMINAFAPSTFKAAAYTMCVCLAWSTRVGAGFVHLRESRSGCRLTRWC